MPTDRRYRQVNYTWKEVEELIKKDAKVGDGYVNVKAHIYKPSSLSNDEQQALAVSNVTLDIEERETVSEPEIHEGN